MNNTKVIVVGIGGGSGGGKSTVAKLLAKALGDALVISYDDYYESNIEPAIETWGKITTFNDFRTPLINEHIKLLLDGKAINHPLTNDEALPKRFIILDNAFGRNHIDHGRFLDHMIYIDTPLDVAMARRLLRDFSFNKSSELEALREELESYLLGARNAYLKMDILKEKACLVVNGGLSLNDIVTKIKDFLN